MTTTIADTVQTAVEHEELFYQSTEFWVSFAFVVVVALLVSPVTKAIVGMMKQRINRIKTELQTAENLKLDAQKLYAEYERKYLNTQNEVNAIIANRQAVIEETKKRKMHALEGMLKQKNLEASSKIEMAYIHAKNEINSQISRRTMEILQNVFHTQVSEKEHQNIINDSLKKLEAIEINE